MHGPSHVTGVSWTHDNHTAPLTLVVGSTGKTGRRVAERLTALGRPVRAGSRHSQPPFDWEDPTTWAAAVDGVDQHVPPLLPGHRDARRHRGHRHGHPARRRARRPAHRPALGPRRARGEGGRGHRPRLGCRVDRRPLRVLRPELQRELPDRQHPQWRRSHCLPARSRNRSSTSRTSPTSPSPR